MNVGAVLVRTQPLVTTETTLISAYVQLAIKDTIVEMVRSLYYNMF